MPGDPGRHLATGTSAAGGLTQPNGLRELRFLAGRNVRVDVAGRTDLIGDVTIPLAGGPTAVSFVVKRIADGEATHLPFVVVDECGDLPKFVGGGPAAF